MSTSSHLPEQVSHTSLPPDQRFEPFAIFSVEQEALKTWLTQRANEEYSRLDEKHALAAGQTVVAELLQKFGSVADQQLNVTLVNDAKKGRLATDVPSRAKRLSARVAFWVCFCLEALVGVAQVLFADAGPAVIASAVLLALAAWLAGSGVGGVLVGSLSSTIPPQWEATPRTEGRHEYFRLAIGALMALALAIFRAWTLEGDTRLIVIALTLILAVLIVVSEGFHVFYDEKYKCLWRSMGKAQRWIAIERHAGAAKFYLDHYVNFLRHIAGGGGVRD